MAEAVDRVNVVASAIRNNLIVKVILMVGSTSQKCCGEQPTGRCLRWQIDVEERESGTRLINPLWKTLG
jgi:hypothetical protein